MKNRTTVREQARVSQIIYELRLKGYNQYQIAEAVGLAQSSVSGHLVRRGVRFQGNQHTAQAAQRNLPPLGTIPWRDSEVPPETDNTPQPYHLSIAARAVKDSLRHLRDINGVVRMAYDMTDAVAAHDTAWVNEQRATVAELADYVRRLAAVVESEELRHRARVDHGERDDLRSTPRLVPVSGHQPSEAPGRAVQQGQGGTHTHPGGQGPQGGTQGVL
jgi:hypothetical protein